MYVNSFPCADCARAIVQSGVSELRTYQFDPNDSRFQKHFEVASEILCEGETTLHLFDRNDQAITRQANSFAETRNSENGYLR